VLTPFCTQAKRGSHIDLFNDFIAKELGKFIASVDDKARDVLPLGFTFSFPIQQSSVNHGSLISWTKVRVLYVWYGVARNSMVGTEYRFDTKGVSVNNDFVLQPLM